MLHYPLRENAVRKINWPTLGTTNHLWENIIASLAICG